MSANVRKKKKTGEKERKNHPPRDFQFFLYFQNLI
jgi:hypothetical protein